MVGMLPDERDGIRAWFDDCRAVVVQARRVEHDAQSGQPPPAEQWGLAYPTLVRLEGLTFALASAARVSDPILGMMLVDLGIATPAPPSRLAAAVGMLATGSYGLFGGSRQGSQLGVSTSSGSCNESTRTRPMRREACPILSLGGTFSSYARRRHCRR